MVRQYVSGDSLRQLVFVLASREPYGPEQQRALSASGFYQQLSDWIEAQNRLGKLPQLPEDCRPQRLGGAEQRFQPGCGAGYGQVSNKVPAVILQRVILQQLIPFGFSLPAQSSLFAGR